MVDLILGDMKPREMRVHRGGGRNRPSEPCVIASRQLLEGDPARVCQLVHVVLERLTTQHHTPRITER